MHFPFQRRLGSVAREYPGRRRKGVEFGADAVFQVPGVPAREIAPADALAEEGIPGEKNAVVFAVQADAALCVAGGMDDPQVRIQDPVTFGEQDVRVGDSPVNVQKEGFPLAAEGLEALFVHLVRFRAEVDRVGLVNRGFYEKPLGFVVDPEVLGPRRMVQVTVGEKHDLGGQIQGKKALDDDLRITARIDDVAFFFSAEIDITVRVQRAYNDSFDHGTIRVRYFSPRGKFF